MKHPNDKLGVALVGLGSYNTTQVASAIKQCESCDLVGIVTGTPVKASMWMRMHNIERTNVYTYENFDLIANNPAIDIVYVAVPNAFHIDFVQRAAKARKHVICEKPLGLNPSECSQMIQISKEHGVKLGIGYRLLYDPYIQFLRSIHQEDPITKLEGHLEFNLDVTSDWRYNKAIAGGGALLDIGIYGIYTACYILNDSPTHVRAKAVISSDVKDIETTMQYSLTFKDVKLQFESSYEGSVNEFSIRTQSKDVLLHQAFSPSGQKLLINEKEVTLAPVNPLALQIDDFSSSIINDKPVLASGELGLRDAQIMDAIYSSMRSGQVEPVCYD